MIEMTVTIRGFDAMLRDLRAGVAVADREVAAAVASVLDEAKERAADYPPERSGQTYIRTGDLGSAWATAQPLTARSGHTVTMRVQNLTPYSGYVQDAADQAAIHQGRWDTTAQILRDLEPLSEREIERAAAHTAAAIEGQP